MNQLRRLCILLLLGGIGSTELVFSQSSDSAAVDPAKLVVKEIKFDQAPLKIVMDFLHQKSIDLDPNHKGINIIVGDSAKAVSVSINLDDMSVLQILKIIADQNNLTLDAQPYAYVLRKISIDAVENTKVPSAMGLPISVDLHDVPLDQTIQFISSEARKADPSGKGVNIVINPSVDVTKKITITLNKVPIQEVLRYVADMSGTTLSVKDGIIIIR